MGTTTTYTLLERGYDLFVPAGVPANAPLVLSFHPALSSPSAWKTQMNNTLDAVAEQYGFYVAYPYGTDRIGLNLRTWNAGWCCGYANEVERRDELFIENMLTQLQQDFSIDADRIFMCGFSNGAMMSLSYLCKHPTQIAGLVMVAGALVIDHDECAATIPRPVVHIHGALDQVVLPAGGIGDFSKAYFPPATTTHAFLASRGADVDYFLLPDATHDFDTIEAGLTGQEGTNFAGLVANMVNASA